MSKKKKKKKMEYCLVKNVGDICKKGLLMSVEEKASAAYELFEAKADCLEICIVDENGKFKGLLTRAELMHAFGGQYGYSLHHKKTVQALAKKHTLIVYKDFSIEHVSRLAMKRRSSELYDPIIVLENDRYFGIVTVKDLLMATVSIEVEKANECNPLTTLPGNKVIEQKISEMIGAETFFAIIYLDLDNFKAFNDAYGFQEGDKMIKILAQAMKKAYRKSAFLGHVGGDDFVIVTRKSDVKKRTEQIIHEFTQEIQKLYNKEDWERGYITAKSRKGVMEQFPIASISIAVITNEKNKYEQTIELTEKIVEAKKRAKQVEGNSVVVL